MTAAVLAGSAQVAGRSAELCVTCLTVPGRPRPTRLKTVVCGRCYAAHGGKPAAEEIGPEPAETPPVRYPSGGQRQWLAALARAEWVAEIRVDGREHLLAIARALALAADWTTLETWPGWDTLMARTGLSETSIGRWIQELRLRGWVLLIESGSTPATRPMALTLPDGAVVPRGEGNRRAVYALRIPLSPAEARRWTAEALAAQADAGERETCTAQAETLIAEHHLTPDELANPDRSITHEDPATAEPAQKTAAHQGKPASLVDKKGSPTWAFPQGKPGWEGSYARKSAIVDDLGMPVADPWGGNDQSCALRAPSMDEDAGRVWAVRVPATPFEMQVAAQWLQRRLPIFARLTRKAVRAACRPFWRAGWSNLDLVHAMDHLPSVFGVRAGTPIGSGPEPGFGPRGAWWFITRRLAAWRRPDGEVRPGFYQHHARRKAMRAAVAARYGRAGLVVLRDLSPTTGSPADRPSGMADVVLTPEKIAVFGRRVADQLHSAGGERRLGDPARPGAPARSAPPVDAAAGEHVRAAATEQVATTIAARRGAAAAAEQRHAELMRRWAPQLAAARAELAARTGGGSDTDPASSPRRGQVPVAPAEHDELTPDQRHERARALARGYRRARRRDGIRSQGRDGTASDGSGFNPDSPGS